MLELTRCPVARLQMVQSYKIGLDSRFLIALVQDIKGIREVPLMEGLAFAMYTLHSTVFTCAASQQQCSGWLKASTVPLQLCIKCRAML